MHIYYYQYIYKFAHLCIFLFMYNNLLSFGDVIELRLQCNVSKLLDNIKPFDWKQYNPRKQINRYGLSVTSLDGSMNGIDLDSIAEYNKENNTSYNEASFQTFTEVYHKCDETKKLVEPELYGKTLLLRTI